jgi:hypothetical protein
MKPSDVADILQKKGWDIFKDQGDTLKLQFAADADAALIQQQRLAAPFRTGDGQIALSMLRLLALRAEYDPDRDFQLSAEQVAMRACFRQGQRSVVALIENAIAIDRGQPAKAADPDEATLSADDGR